MVTKFERLQDKYRKFISKVGWWVRSHPISYSVNKMMRYIAGWTKKIVRWITNGGVISTEFAGEVASETLLHQKILLKLRLRWWFTGQFFCSSGSIPRHFLQCRSYKVSYSWMLETCYSTQQKLLRKLMCQMLVHIFLFSQACLHPEYSTESCREQLTWSGTSNFIWFKFIEGVMHCNW